MAINKNILIRAEQLLKEIDPNCRRSWRQNNGNGSKGQGAGYSSDVNNGWV